jgi:hypothetical protein
MPLAIDDVLIWAQWFETADRQIARTDVGEVKVSTVFLGMDHGWGDGAPVLWETMLFGGPEDQTLWRYSSRMEALAGHAEAVALVEAARTGQEVTPCD